MSLVVFGALSKTEVYQGIGNAEPRAGLPCQYVTVSDLNPKIFASRKTRRLKSSASNGEVNYTPLWNL